MIDLKPKYRFGTHSFNSLKFHGGGVTREKTIFLQNRPPSRSPTHFFAFDFLDGGGAENKAPYFFITSFSTASRRLILPSINRVKLLIACAFSSCVVIM